MNFEEYRRERSKLFAKQPYQKETNTLLWASNSLCGEVGELANEVKKIFRDDHGKITDERINKLMDEGGDVIWYLFFFFEDTLGVPLEFLMQRNMDKLKKRYKINELQL